MSLTNEQMYNEYYAIMKQWPDGSTHSLTEFVQFTDTINKETQQLFMDPFINSLMQLEQAERRKEQFYLERLKQNLLSDGKLPPKTANLVNQYLTEDNFDISQAFNLLEVALQESIEDFKTYTDFLNARAEELKQYNNKTWIDITKKAIEEAYNRNLSIQDTSILIQERITEKALNSALPEKVQQHFKRTLESYTDTWIEGLLEKYSSKTQILSPQNLLTIIDDTNPYIVKKRSEDKGKHKNDSISKLIGLFSFGILNGMVGEKYKGVLNFNLMTGEVSTNEKRLDASIIKDVVRAQGLNIDADIVTIYSGKFVAETNDILKALSPNGDRINLTDFDEAIRSKYDKNLYFRIEQSVKESSSSKGEIKIKGEASLNSRLAYLTELGEALGKEKMAHDLCFMIINGAEGFIGDGINKNTISDAIASMSLAYMFDLDTSPLVTNYENMVNESLDNYNGEVRLHIYSINGIYYTVSDILKYIRLSITKVKDEFGSSYSSPIRISLSYGGITAKNVQKALSEKKFFGQDAWDAVRYTVTGGFPRAKDLDLGLKKPSMAVFIKFKNLQDMIQQQIDKIDKSIL